MTEAQKNQITLKEAFPTVDDNVIKAILRASGGQVEPAFNALLGALRAKTNISTGTHAYDETRNDRPRRRSQRAARSSAPAAAKAFAIPD